MAEKKVARIKNLFVRLLAQPYGGGIVAVPQKGKRQKTKGRGVKQVNYPAGHGDNRKWMRRAAQLVDAEFREVEVAPGGKKMRLVSTSAPIRKTEKQQQLEASHRIFKAQKQAAELALKDAKK